MPNKKSKKESGKVTLARVRKEMAEPRLARSVRVEELNQQDHRNGRKAHASHSRRLTTEVVAWPAVASFPDGRADSFSSCWFSAGSEAKHLVNSLALARDDDSRVCGRNASEWLQGSKLMAKHLEQYSTRPEYGGSPRGALFGGWRLICLRVVAL